MHKIEIPSQKFTAEFPSTINELTPNQYLYFLNLVLQLQQEIITEQTFKIKLTYKLIGLKPDKNTTPQKLDNITRLAELAESFITTTDSKRTVNLTTVINLIPTIKLGKTTFNGPGNALQKITFGQFIAANAAYNAYTEGNKKALHKLTASLYLPAGDAYNPENQNIHPEIQNAPPEFLYSVSLLFQSTIEFITTGPILLSGIAIDLRILFKGESKNPGHGLQGVLFTLAESGVFGTVKQTAKAHLYDVLLRLHQVTQQANEAEKKANKT